MPPNREAFIAQMLPYAERWSQATGIPPEVFIAIGGSETNWGNAGSMFGIKGTGPSGKSATYQTHEVINGQRVDMPDQFAIYDNPDQAFEHFVGLVSQGRYRPAWDHLQATGDWRGFLNGINKAGYATDPGWGDMIAGLSRTVSQLFGGSTEGASVMPQVNPAPEGLPQGTELIGNNLARWLDPATQEYVYFRNNPQPYLDVNTNNIIPAGWVPAGSLPQPNATKTNQPQGAVSEAELRQAGAQFGVGTATLGGQRYVKNSDGTWTASGSGTSATAQGAVTSAQLQQAGAQMGVGTATLRGQRYTQNPDGTWSPSGTPANNSQIISGAGLARLYPGLAQTNAANTTSAQSSSASGSTSAPPPARQAPQDSLNADDVAQAASLSGIQRGETLGAVEPRYTGLGGPLPINYGGVYEGGGLTPIPGFDLIAASNPQFSGFVPGDKGPTSVGFGFNPRMILEAAGLPPTGLANDTDVALNVMSARQYGQDHPANPFIDLPSMQAVNSRGDAPKNQYRDTLASVSKSLGRPLSELDLTALAPDMTSPYGSAQAPRIDDQGVFYDPTKYPTPMAEGGSVTYEEPKSPMQSTGMPDSMLSGLKSQATAVSGPGPTPGSVPVPQATGMDQIGMPPTAYTGSGPEAISARGYSSPRYNADGTMTRGHGDNAVVAPMTGGNWQGIWQSQVPNWKDYLQYFWNGVEYSPGSALATYQRSYFGDIVRSYGQKHGLWNNGPEFQGMEPQNMTDSLGRRYNLQSGGYGGMGGSDNFFGIGSFAQGGQISAGNPMQSTGMPQMVTDEPMVGIGMYSNQPRFTVGEPNMLNGGMPTREVLSGGNGTMNVTPLEASVPMTAPYKSKRPVMLVDPLKVLMEMAA